MLAFWAQGSDQLVAQLRKRLSRLRWRVFFSRDPELARELRELEALYAAETEKNRHNLHLTI